MADPATNTAYPEAIETFPEISSGRRMIEADVRHDVMHDKLHATVNALQALVGVTDAEAQDPESLLPLVAQLRLGGVLVQCGSKHADAEELAVGTEISGIVPSNYSLTAWKLWVYPASTLTIDVRKKAFAGVPPTADDTITGITPPEVDDEISAEATIDPEDWSVDLVVGDAVTAVVTSNAGAKWFALQLFAIKKVPE